MTRLALLLLFTLIAVQSAALAADTPVSATSPATSPNDTCLACHSDPSITGDRAKKPFVDPIQFARTSHASLGCSTCHDAVPDVHPDNKKPVSKAKCKDCHAEIQKIYLASLHGPNATCGDCHNPHTVKPPIAVSGSDINHQCEACHSLDQVLGSHSKWLPQASLHMEAAPCISCHTDSKDYVITLFPEKREAPKPRSDFRIMTHYEINRLLPAGTSMSQWIDTDKNGTVSLDELRQFNLKTRPRDVRLWGVMMPEKMDHNFHLLVNRRDCSFCHLSGPEARQSSFVAFPERDGSFSRIPVEKGAVMDILFGTPDFYMVGSTRSPILTFLGIAIFAGGALFPIIHGTFRYRTRHNRKKGGSE